MPGRDELLVCRMAGAGTISLGKTNTPEFGAGSHTVNRVFGATCNPYDLSRSAGGSSGGAAAALAARMVCLADGSDLGGSLRNPASFGNVAGLRPSPGRVPKWPVTDPADTMGVEGPMARTVADTALLLAVQSGPDPRAALALDAPPPPLAAPADVTRVLARDLRGLRVAWSADLGLPVEPAVQAALAPARTVLAGLGCQVTDAAPDLAGGDEVFRTFRALRFVTAFGPLLRDHPGDVGPNVAWNIERGQELTVADLSRATTLWAAPRDLGARRVHPGRPAGWAAAGRPPPGRLAPARRSGRLRGSHRLHPDRPEPAELTRHRTAPTNAARKRQRRLGFTVCPALAEPCR